MYKIIKDGTLLALCDEPRYIKVNPESGAYIQTDEEHASGIAFNGEPYKLIGRDGIDAPEVVVVPVDGASFLFENYVPKEKYDEAIANLEDVLCQLDKTGGLD